MRLLYLLHIGAGALGLLTGYVALFSAKGGPRHRQVGRVFVPLMLVMALVGLSITLLRNVAMSVNIPAALLTAYLVVTSFTTVKPPSRGARQLHMGLMLVVGMTAVASLTFAVQALTGNPPDGMPAFPFLMFGVVGALAAAGDARILRQGMLTGPRRVARHLWRMCFALFIAALSFFIGQADEFPEPIRIMPLLALPVLVVLVSMFYWLWRVRIRRSLRGLVTSSAQAAAIS